MNDAVRLNPSRLAAVHATGLLDTDVEEAFDRLTRLAVRLVGIPAAFISLVDENGEFYKSACGFEEPLATSREFEGVTFCQFTIQSTEPLVIPDTAADPRYHDVPTVKTLGVAAYVGIPLVVNGEVIGAFCAIDRKRRDWALRDIENLSELAAIAISEIDLRASQKRLKAAHAEAVASQLETEVARRRMQDVFRQAPAFIAVLRGRDHVFESVNDQYTRLVGRSDILGLSVDEALPEVRAQGFIALLDRVLETGEPFIGHELPVTLKPHPLAEPDERFVTLIYQPLVEADGSRSGIVALGVDVTEQVSSRRAIEVLNVQLQDQAAELEVQTEELSASTEELQVSTEELMERTTAAELAREALEASEARYRLLTEAVPVQVWTATIDGALDYVSAQTSAYFGVPDREVLGDGWTSFLHPDDLASAGMTWKESLETGRPYQAEFRLRNGRNGGYRWHLARALPNRDANGNIIGWVGSNTDVEDERLARAEAEAANRSKSEFLTVMSHELRTPLNAIGGFAELLEMEVHGPVSEAQRNDLERIQRSQRHLLGLINGILNFAKVDAGAMEYAVENVSMDEVLATCESLTSPLAAKRGLTLTFPRNKCGLVAVADREKVQQVLLNLLSNAVKFTEPGGEVTVSCANADDHVVVHVRDTGRGIPPDQLERIFQPFVQIDARLTQDQPGTGLGLAISRELARAMGGDLTGLSEMGAGSTFSAHFKALGSDGLTV